MIKAGDKQWQREYDRGNGRKPNRPGAGDVGNMLGLVGSLLIWLLLGAVAVVWAMFVLT